MQKAYKRVLFYIVAWCSAYGAISDLFAKIRDFYRARYGKLSVRPSVRLPTGVFTIRPFGLRPCPPPAKNASTKIFYDHPLKYNVQMCRKITRTVATRCNILRLKCTTFDFGWGSASDPAGGAYSAPQTHSWT